MHTFYRFRFNPAEAGVVARLVPQDEPGAAMLQALLRKVLVIMMDDEVKEARRRDFVLLMVIAVGLALVALSVIGLLYVASTYTR